MVSGKRQSVIPPKLEMIPLSYNLFNHQLCARERAAFICFDKWTRLLVEHSCQNGTAIRTKRKLSRIRRLIVVSRLSNFTTGIKAQRLASNVNKQTSKQTGLEISFETHTKFARQVQVCVVFEWCYWRRLFGERNWDVFGTGVTSAMESSCFLLPELINVSGKFCSIKRFEINQNPTGALQVSTDSLIATKRCFAQKALWKPSNAAVGLIA